MPEVHAEGDSFTFRLDVAGILEPVKLVLRCNTRGEIWASITLDKSAARPRE